MKLIFRPDPFVDKKGERIELEDIEIIDFGALNDEVTVEFTFKGEWLAKGHEGIEGCNMKDLQKDIEYQWNQGNEFLLSKRKSPFTTKQKVDLGKPSFFISNLHPALDMINEEDIQAPTAPTRPQIYLDLNDDGHKKMKMPDGSTFCITCSKLE